MLRLCVLTLVTTFLLHHFLVDIIDEHTEVFCLGNRGSETFIIFVQRLSCYLPTLKNGGGRSRNIVQAPVS